jgi:GGDEF domain-containing protein
MPGAIAESTRRASLALIAAAREIALQEPMLAVLLRAQRELTGSWEPERLIEHWSTRALGNPIGSDRYRWELTHKKGTGVPAYAGLPGTWRAWRSSEQAVLEGDVFGFEERLTGLILACESVELLAEADSVDARSFALLDEAMPVLRRDVAACALERNAWADSFGVWCVTRYPRTFETLQPVVMAVAESMALRARASAGIVKGTRFPLHDRPLVSATAQLASTLLRLGAHFEIVAGAVRFVAASCTSSGGWADVDDPPDLLTTLVAADLLASCDPDFDPLRTALFIVERQEQSGWFRALGPEIPWLTLELMRFLRTAQQPFAVRFRWPHVPAANLDRKTGLPFFAYFAELTRLFRELSGVARSALDVGFIDLIGFREFNNRFGQQQGDEVLAEFAAALRELPEVKVVRDGGDEFLLVGAPESKALAASVAELQRSWPARFRARFGADAPTVLARAITARTRGAELGRARETLGRAIGELKTVAVDPELGILRQIEL